MPGHGGETPTPLNNWWWPIGSRYSGWPCACAAARPTPTKWPRREKRQIAAADITEVSAADPAPSPQQQAEQSEQREIVRAAILQLAPEQREVVVLRFMEELSYEEIGAVLKLPSGTVKSRLNRAKAQLKEILSNSGNLFGAGSVIHTETKGKEARP